MHFLKLFAFGGLNVDEVKLNCLSLLCWLKVYKVCIFGLVCDCDLGFDLVEI